MKRTNGDHFNEDAPAYPDGNHSGCSKLEYITTTLVASLIAGKYYNWQDDKKKIVAEARKIAREILKEE